MAQQSSRENSPSLQPFCPTQALNGLDNAHPLWGRWFALSSPPVHRLISSRKTLSQKPLEITFHQLYVPCEAVQLTHTVSHHSPLPWQLQVPRGPQSPT